MIEWATATNRAIAPMEFPDALHYLMKNQKMTVEHLEETSLISTRTIIRLSNDPDYGVTREHIVALSVGLTLPPIISMELLRKAGLPRPIGAEAVDLQRVAVIQKAAHRAAADGDTGEPPVLPDADGELVSHRGLVVAVVLAHELVRLPQGDGDQRQHITHRPRRHGCPA